MAPMTKKAAMSLHYPAEFYRNCVLIAVALAVPPFAASRPAQAQDSIPAGNCLPNYSFEQTEGDGVGGWKSCPLGNGS